MKKTNDYALSLKQPWAALIVHGLKTIEVRSWPTACRGRVLIHAALVSDPRPEAWIHVPPELEDRAHLCGGILGQANSPVVFLIQPWKISYAIKNAISMIPAGSLAPSCTVSLSPMPFPFPSGPFPAGCVSFRSIPVFSKRKRQPAKNHETDHHGCAGPVFPRKRPRQQEPAKLLVSVRSVAEAQAALAGGADLIDIKEPRHGSLGRADDETLQAIVQWVAGRRPVSAALGELLDYFEPTRPGGKAGQTWTPINFKNFSYLKWGLRGYRGRDWMAALNQIEKCLQGPQLVTVAYADWHQAQAPPVEDLIDFACRKPGNVLLVDTWNKDNGHTLLDWLSLHEVTRLCVRCREAEVRVALAGSLGPADIKLLKPAMPTWFAVRGAACGQGRRQNHIQTEKVRELRQILI